MKKHLLLVLGLIALSVTGATSCDDDTPDAPKDETPEAQADNYGTLAGSVEYSPGEVVILAVDYTTNSFLGGYTVPAESPGGDFALDADYLSPGDFGSVTIYEKASNSKLFAGYIIWDGKGRMAYPAEMYSPKGFALMDKPVALPDFTHYDYSASEFSAGEYDLATVKNAVGKLKIVGQARANAPAAPVYAALYTRSVGDGNPADWYWLIFIRG